MTQKLPQIYTALHATFLNGYTKLQYRFAVISEAQYRAYTRIQGKEKNEGKGKVGMVIKRREGGKR